MFVVFSLAGIIAVLQTTFFGSADTNQTFSPPPENSGSTILDGPAQTRPLPPGGCEVDPATGIETCSI